jgi:hypothetical protein
MKRNFTSKLDQGNHNQPEEWLQAAGYLKAFTVYAYGIGSKQQTLTHKAASRAR